MNVTDTHLHVVIRHAVYGLSTSVLTDQTSASVESNMGDNNVNSISYPKLSLLGGGSGEDKGKAPGPGTPPPGFPNVAMSGPPLLNRR